MVDVLPTILIGPALRLLGRLPGWLLREYFTPDRMSTLLRLDVRPRGDQLVLYGGDVPHVRLCFRVENRAPFAVELDRLKIEVYAPGHLGDMWYHEGRSLDAGQAADLCVNGLFGLQYPIHIRRNVRDGQAAISFTGFFVAKVGRFSALTGQLQGINSKCVNYPDEAA